LIDAIDIEDQAEQDEAFDELLSGVNDSDRLKIFALAEKLPAIMAERVKLEANSKEAAAELDARSKVERDKAALAAVTERKAAVELVADRVVKKLPFLTASDKFTLDSIKTKVADADLDALDVSTKAYNAYAGWLLPQFANERKAFVKDIETLTDELAKYKKANPSLNGNAAHSASVSDDNLTFEQAVERAMAGFV